jgi:FkbM family methyltransferase
VVIDRLFNKIERFIDIGANNGITGSNTFKFALNGAEGLCFEPVKEIFNYLRNLYFLNFKVRCINEGISNLQKELEIRVDGALSAILNTEDPVNKACLQEFIDIKAKTEKITVRPLTFYQDLYPEYYKIDLLSIDVEGHELNVIKGIDFNTTEVKCIILESLGGQTTNYKDIEKILIYNKLIPVLTNQLNTIFIHNDFLSWQEIKEIPFIYPEFILIDHHEIKISDTVV